MISKDYESVISTGKYVEKEVLRCISQVHKGPASEVARRLFIPPGVHIIDRYIEALFVNTEEIGALEISGRTVCIMPAGYRIN